MVTGIIASEAQNLDSIIALLVMMNIPYIRVTNTGTIIQREGKIIFGKRKYQQIGAPDIVCAWKGWPICIEVKRAGQKARPEQKNWLMNWSGRGGGAWIVASGVDQVMNFLEALKKRE